MPATVSRVEVSSGGGISDAEGTRRWPRCSKKLRYVSRISADFMNAGAYLIVPWPTTVSPLISTAA